MADDPHREDLIFVYGTLRAGFIDNETTLAFRDRASPVCAGWLPGRLYLTGWYPALKEDGPGRVTGEIWRMETPGLLAMLDAYEGIGGARPEYERVRRDVRTTGGTMSAWVYLHVGAVDPARRIASGDWSDAVIDPGAAVT